VDSDPSVAGSPDGVLLSADKQGSAATGVLLALKLPGTGKYTVDISWSHGARDYQVRLIDGDRSTVIERLFARSCGAT
jgi:hypothetical protein